MHCYVMLGCDTSHHAKILHVTSHYITFANATDREILSSIDHAVSVGDAPEDIINMGKGDTRANTECTTFSD